MGFQVAGQHAALGERLRLCSRDGPESIIACLRMSGREMSSPAGNCSISCLSSAMVAGDNPDDDVSGVVNQVNMVCRSCCFGRVCVMPPSWDSMPKTAKRCLIRYADWFR